MDTLELLRDYDAVLQDHHFVYKSGKHGPHYINMDSLFPFPELLLQLGNALARASGSRNDVDTVVGAATGGIPLAYFTALGMNDAYLRPHPKVVWADKKGDDFVFERAGYANHLNGKRVLVVEDLLNTGDTTKKVIAQAQLHGAVVVSVCVVCNRGSETAESLGVPRLEALCKVDFQAFASESCPLCEAAVPIVANIGHGEKFQLEHPDYSGGYTKLAA